MTNVTQNKTTFMDDIGEPNKILSFSEKKLQNLGSRQRLMDIS